MKTQTRKEFITRLIQRNNGNPKGLYTIQSSIRRNWTNAQKDQHASMLIKRCQTIENECLAAVSENTYDWNEFDRHYSAFLKYHAIALRLIEYRIRLMVR